MPSSITGKLVAWFVLVAVVVVAMTAFFFAVIFQTRHLSQAIVQKNGRISLQAKAVAEALLAMEASARKYRVLAEPGYLDGYKAAWKQVAGGLDEITAAAGQDGPLALAWQRLKADFLLSSPAEPKAAQDMAGQKQLNRWLQAVTEAQRANQAEIQEITARIHHHSLRAARIGLAGLAVFALVGVGGLLMLAVAIVRPVRELKRGIAAIADDRTGPELAVRSDDEFGQLARTFNRLRRRLQEEEQMRSDFISMLSHEIRNPLTAVRESVNMIAEEVMGPVTERQRKFLDIASDEIGRICRLLNHLMQASRISPASLVRSRRLVPVEQLIHQVVRAISPAAEAKQIRVETDLDQGLVPLTCDPDLIRQALLNLAQNAVKFSPAGSVVRIEARHRPRRGRLVVSVVDNGPGILEEERERLFHKYYRGPRWRDRLDGVGLGLSIAKAIVEAHEGRLGVESAVGRGSRFFISLPAGPAVVPARRKDD